MIPHPLTTEEPLNSPELEKEIESINEVDPNDDQVPAAVIVEKEDPNKLVGDDDIVNEAPEVIEDINKVTSVGMYAAATTSTSTTTASGALDIISPITNQYFKEESSEEEDTDDELLRITESNRHIPATEAKPIDDVSRVNSLRSQSVSTRRHLLVFAENPTTTKRPDRITVHNHYGAGPSGKLEKELRPTRRSRGYLVACDFSDESFHSMEWTMGTMMRDGDKLYVVTVVNREDNPETVKEAGLSLQKELKKASEAVTEKAVQTMEQMLLFDVDVYTYAICGKVKDVLSSLIDELPLTMVICGSRGRGTVKGLLMGSVSTFLVHKSPVPVTVIKPQKKKMAATKKPIHAAPLSHSVKTGQLAVDELSKPAETTAATTT